MAELLGLAMTAYALAYVLAALHRVHLLRRRDDWPLAAVWTEVVFAAAGIVTTAVAIALRVVDLAS